MLSDLDKATFDRDGFLVVPGLVTGAALAMLQENLQRYIRDVVPLLDAAEAFYQDRSRPQTLKQLQRMDQHDPFFASYRANPDWHQLAETLLGEAVGNVQGPEWFNKPPDTEHPTPPHQDNYYFCLSPPSVLTIWLPLEDVDAENGCLRYVRGSHRAGLRPHGVTEILGFSQSVSDYGAADTEQEVMIELQAGDALVHHGNTIHRADPNRSKNRHRPALAMIYDGISARIDAAAQATYQANSRKHRALLAAAENG